MNSIGTISSNQSLRKSDSAELTTQQTQTIFRRLCRITGNREDAEDAMQDAFMRALEHLEDFEGRAAFSTWFTRIAINSALVILRKRKNTRTVSLDGPSGLQEIRDPARDAEQRYLQTEREKTVQDAIEELRPSLRSVIEVGHLGERSMRETAEIIGVSVGATKARLFHARAALRKSRKLRSFRNGPTFPQELFGPGFPPNPQKSSLKQPEVTHENDTTRTQR